MDHLTTCLSSCDTFPSLVSISSPTRKHNLRRDMFVLVRYLLELGIDYITDKKAQSSENASHRLGQPGYKPRPCSPLANSQFRHHVRAHMHISTRLNPSEPLAVPSPPCVASFQWLGTPFLSWLIISSSCFFWLLSLA